MKFGKTYIYRAILIAVILVVLTLGGIGIAYAAAPNVNVTRVSYGLVGAPGKDEVVSRVNLTLDQNLTNGSLAVSLLNANNVELAYFSASSGVNMTAGKPQWFSLVDENNGTSNLPTPDKVYFVKVAVANGILVPTCVCVTSSQNPSNSGQSVTFTAKVSGSGGTPTGTIQFQTDGINFGSPVTLVNGSASSTAIATLSVGNHVVTAIYSGDSGFATSTGTLYGGQTVKQVYKSTSTAVSSSLNPSNFGQSVIFTAIVTGSGGTPTGIVQFKVDGSNFGSPVSLINGTANSAATTTLAVGNHTVTAVYSGDGNYATSNGTLSGGQTVKPVLKSTSTVVSSSLNPSVYGQSVTFTATITGAGGTPSGTVQFKVDGSNFGSPVSLINGRATSTPISTLSVGSHTVTASYNGDTNFAGSNSAPLTQTVKQALKSTSVYLSSSLNPSVIWAVGDIYCNIISQRGYRNSAIPD